MTKKYIQSAPIIVYTIPKTDGEMVYSKLFFHSSYPDMIFEEFCLNVVMAHVDMLKNKGEDVYWGYVNVSNQSIDGAKTFLLKEIDYLKC